MTGKAINICSFCEEQSDELTLGSDGETTACADCMAEGEEA